MAILLHEALFNNACLYNFENLKKVILRELFCIFYQIARSSSFIKSVTFWHTYKINHHSKYLTFMTHAYAIQKTPGRCPLYNPNKSIILWRTVWYAGGLSLFNKREQICDLPIYWFSIIEQVTMKI